jgi:hypothetical protein
MLVTTASLHLWEILTYILHQTRANTRAPDVFHLQQQAALRNSRGYMPTLLQVVKILWSWRKRSQRVYRRSSFLICLCTLYSIFFVFAGLFSSRIVTFTDQILVRSPSCGWMERFPRVLTAGTTWTPDDRQVQAINALALTTRSAYRRSSSYVRACYMEQKGVYSSVCQTLMKQRLESRVEMRQECPFPADICTTPTLVFDSGHIKSDLDLGLSTSEQNRVTLRRVSSAVPLRIDEYLSDWLEVPAALRAVFDLPLNETYKALNLGPLEAGDMPWTTVTTKTSYEHLSSGYAIRYVP